MDQPRDPFGAACRAYCEHEHQPGVNEPCDQGGNCQRCREVVALIIRTWNEEGLTR